MDQEGVAGRLRTLRKLRGMSQLQLARAASFSASLVKQVEQGRTPPSAAFVAAAANALKVTPAYLYGTQERELAEQPAIEIVGISDLRAALDEYDDPRPDGEPLTAGQAAARLTDVWKDIHRLRYGDAAKSLPQLLPHLYVLAGSGEEGRELLHDGYRLAASVAGQFTQRDLAAIATERHIALAPATGNPRRMAISAYHRSSRHLQSGDYGTGLRTLARAHQYLGRDLVDHTIAIQLHLRSAILAARSGDRTRADDYVREARSLSERFDPPQTPYFNIDASRINIDVHWCAVPAENYEGTESVKRAEHLRINDPTRPERVGHHHIDQARAWLLHGDRDRALAHLNTARRIAPVRIRNHPQVHATVRAIAEADRRVTDSLAGFARWAGISV